MRARLADVPEEDSTFAPAIGMDSPLEWTLQYGRQPSIVVETAAAGNVPPCGADRFAGKKGRVPARPGGSRRRVSVHGSRSWNVTKHAILTPARAPTTLVPARASAASASLTISGAASCPAAASEPTPSGSTTVPSNTSPGSSPAAASERQSYKPTRLGVAAPGLACCPSGFGRQVGADDLVIVADVDRPVGEGRMAPDDRAAACPGRRLDQGRAARLAIP